MHKLLFGLLVLALALTGCGSDEPWDTDYQEVEQDSGIEDTMGTFQQTRLGNQIVMPGGLVGGQPPVNPILLIEANLEELSRAVANGELALPDLGFGPWVFMVDIVPTWAPPAGGWAVNPLKLRFTMGSGGTHHLLEVDAVGGAAVQVPTATVRVEVFWDRLPQTLGVGLPPFEIPSSVIVRGTLHRANVVPNARRSFLLGRNAAGAVATNGLIPPYSYDWMIYSIGASTLYIAASANILACSSPAVNIITLTTGPQMLAAVATGARFPVPPMVDFWQMADGGPAVTVGLIDFGVGF